MSGEVERIGDAAKEKWLSFLARALELGYLDLEEYTRRMEALLAARTRDDLLPVVEELDWRPWAAAWDKGRKSAAILPEGVILPEGKSIAILSDAPQQPPVLTSWQIRGMALLLAFCTLGWVLYLVTVL